MLELFYGTMNCFVKYCENRFLWSNTDVTTLQLQYIFSSFFSKYMKMKMVVMHWKEVLISLMELSLLNKVLKCSSVWNL